MNNNNNNRTARPERRDGRFHLFSLHRALFCNVRINILQSHRTRPHGPRSQSMHQTLSVSVSRFSFFRTLCARHVQRLSEPNRRYTWFVCTCCFITYTWHIRYNDTSIVRISHNDEFNLSNPTLVTAVTAAVVGRSVFCDAIFCASGSDPDVPSPV